MTEFNPSDYLDQITEDPKADYDIAFAAVALGARNYPGRVLERYINHIKQLHDCTAERHTELVMAGALDDIDTRIAAIKYALFEKYGYQGDTESYDSLQNANLIEVIERRKGLPVALGILFMSCAAAQGWEAEGLNFPAHFILRMDMDGDRRILDPFNGVKVLAAPDLRDLVKTFLGPRAELSASFYEAVQPVDVLIRLQNNLKLRLIDMEQYDEALAVVKQISAIAPHEKRFFLDEGVLLAKLGQRHDAIDKLEEYLGTDVSWRERQDIEAFIHELRTTLH